MEFPESFTIILTPEDAQGEYWSHDCSIGRAISRTFDFPAPSQVKGEFKNPENGAAMGVESARIFINGEAVARYIFPEFSEEDHLALRRGKIVTVTLTRADIRDEEGEI